MLAGVEDASYASLRFWQRTATLSCHEKDDLRRASLCIQGFRRWNRCAETPFKPLETQEMRREKPMSIITYKIVEHDGGWAYKLGDVFSETFRTREAAVEAAKMVAAEQRIPGKTEAIEYEDSEGKWHEELARGDDRPITDVVE